MMFDANPGHTPDAATGVSRAPAACGAMQARRAYRYRNALGGLLVLLLAACSYQGAETWRRNICHEIADAGERERCLEDANRPEPDYRERQREAVTE